MPIFIVLFSLVSITTTAQRTLLSSSKNTVTIANGTSTSVNFQKQLYFRILIYSEPYGPNNLGYIDMADTPIVNQSVDESFPIYSAQLGSDGVLHYWSDKSKIGQQIVLFEVDNNSAVPTITVSRYSPVDKNKLLKQTIYYID